MTFTDSVGPDFTLWRDGTPVYVLSPAIGDSAPTATPVTDGEFFHRLSELRIDDPLLSFELPDDLIAGRYELCSSSDECHPIDVD